MLAEVADRRPAVPVSRPLPELAVALYLATQRANYALDAARLLAFTHPSRVAAIAVAEAEREVAALAEAHGLVKHLIPHEGELRHAVPQAFGDGR